MTNYDYSLWFDNTWSHDVVQNSLSDVDCVHIIVTKRLTTLIIITCWPTLLAAIVGICFMCHVISASLSHYHQLQGVSHTPLRGVKVGTFAQHPQLHILITPLISHRGVLNIIITFAKYEHYLVYVMFIVDSELENSAWNSVIWFSGKSLNYCHQMSDLKAKMHQIQFRLWLCPRPRWGSLQHSPRSLSWI